MKHIVLFVFTGDIVTGIIISGLGVWQQPDAFCRSFFYVARMLKRALWSAAADSIH